MKNVKKFDEFVNEDKRADQEELIEFIRKMASKYDKEVFMDHYERGVGFTVSLRTSERSRHGGLTYATEFYGDDKILLDIVNYRTVYSGEDIDLETAKEAVRDASAEHLY